MDFDFDTGKIYQGLQTLDVSVTPPAGGTAGVLTVVGTGAVTLPVGTNAQRPANTAGMIRYNTDTGAMEYNTGSGWVTFASGSGVTSVTVTTVSPGLLVSAGTSQTITGSGTFALTLGAELVSLSNLSTTGIVARTGSATYTPRTITGTAGNITVTNGDGVSGAPTIDLATVTQGATGTSFVKIQLDTKGRVINNTAVVTGDITALVDGTYVNISGDSMSSGANLTFSGGGEILGLPATPTTGGSATSKTYVDSLVSGLSWKTAVRAATTTNGTLASAFANGQTIDGITLATNDRILIKNQTTQTENGIYIVQASGAPVRSSDADTGAELVNATVYVDQGTVNADTGWTQTTNAPITIGSSNIVWVQFSGSGAYTAGSGLTLTGNSFSITAPVSPALGGTGTITAPTAGQVLIGTSGNIYTPATLTNGTAISITSASGSITINNTGVTSIAGTTNQITASASTGAVTLSLPSAVTIGSSLTVSGLTANSFLYSGTAGLLTTTSAPTNGQLLIGSTGAAPVAATLSAGTAIGISNAAGSITINNTGVTAIAGTANQITLSASTGSVTVSLPSAVTIGSSLTVSGLTANSFLYSGTAGLLTTTSAPTNGQLLIGSTGGAPALATLTGGTGISISNGSGSITVNNTGVTSVALSDGSSSPIYSISGSPVTTTGTLTFTLNTQTTNKVFASPNGSTGQPTFRALAYADLPLQLYVENPSTPTAPTAAGSNAVAIGSGSSASATGAFAVGAGSNARIFGMKAFSNGNFVTAGDAQEGVYVFRNLTTDATVTELFLDGTGASQRLILPNNSLFTFDILVSARRTDATGGGAAYRFVGVIKKDTTAGSTTFVGTPSKTVIGETNTAWDANVTADTTNGSLRVNVTGEATKTIRWVASVRTSEVTN